jgi:hypothetical protein
MQVMAEQQEMIKAVAKRSEAQDVTFEGLLKIAKSQQEEIKRLTRGLQAISIMAGVEHRVASAMGLKFIQADVLNPAEPVPEPPAVAPTQSTVDAKTPEAMADVNAPGLVPGSTQDVAADVTTTNYTPGQDIPAPAFKNLQDVTAPIDGTQGQRPLSETKTETDVRVGDPMNPQTAFPLRGPWQNAQRTSSTQKTAQQIAEDASLRTMASLNLARLRMKAGIATAGSDIELAQHIEKDASLDIDGIEREITTLKAVVGRQVSQDRNQSLVPKSAQRRQAPSLAGGGERETEPSDEMLFL